MGEADFASQRTNAVSLADEEAVKKVLAIRYLVSGILLTT